MRTQRPARSVSDFRYSPLFAALSLAFGSAEALAGNTFSVTVPGDRFPITAPTTPNTLRAAIEFFNISDATHCTGSGDKIVFDGPSFSNGAFFVGVSDALPFIACDGLTIDGAGPSAGIRATVSGGNQAINYGLRSQSATPVTVKNLEVDSFSYGTALSGNINATNNVLKFNSYGYDPDGYSGLAVVGNTVQNNSDGIRAFTSNVTIDSNQVSANTNHGIVVQGDNLSITGNTIVSNYIGIYVSGPNVSSGNHVSITGNNPIASNATGIYVSYGGSTVVIDANVVTNNFDAIAPTAKGIHLVGSSAIVSNNLISGNDYAVYLQVDAGSKISNNRIGTTDDGLQPFSGGAGAGNGHAIVFTWPGFGTLNRSTEISGNTISGNRDYGIDLADFTNVKITGNNIGVRKDGVPPGMGNTNGGIIAFCGSGIEVTGNTVSANSGTGIEFGAVQGGGAVAVSGNKIGVTGDGVTALGNSAYGVAIRFGACTSPSTPSGGTNNLVINGNIIAGNTADGVLVSEGTGNTIVENSIHDNGGKNVNLGSPGPLPRPNDPPLDADGGPNNGQDYPVPSAADRDWAGSQTVLSYSLSGPAGDYRIDAYSNDSGTPGGKVWQGAKTISIPASNTITDTFQVGGLSTSNQPNNFSLTATAVATKDTSEFSPTAFINPVPAVSVTPNPPNLDFGQVPINSTSPQQTITLRSSGNEPYRIFRIGLGNCFGPTVYGGPFMIASTCVPNVDYVPPDGGCTITGRFAPLALGPQSISIAICDNTNIDSNPTRTFTLTGIGSAPPPISVQPSEFDFGSIPFGSKSAPQQFVINNPSPSVVVIGPVTVSTDEFAIKASTCGASIPAGGFCTADVIFQPSRPWTTEATLSVMGAAPAASASAPAVKVRKINSTAGSATAHLTGTGIRVADIQLPSSIDFGAYTLGFPALRQNVQITNTGNAVISFSNISATGPFVLNNGCPLNILPGESCTIALDFSVTTLGDFTGALSVVSNAVGGTRSIPLTGHSVAVPAAKLAVSPNSVSFGDRLLGTTSATQRVTIRNIGNAPGTVTSITASADFIVSNNTCTLPLAPASTCFADVALRPVGFGPRSGSLFVNSDVAGSPNVVSLNGTGCRPFSSSASRFGAGSGFNCAP